MAARGGYRDAQVESQHAAVRPARRLGPSLRAGRGNRWLVRHRLLERVRRVRRVRRVLRVGCVAHCCSRSMTSGPMPALRGR
ncbi:hypothetical protein FMEAI12_2340008 [Parafrankia sp. Ea1.12]|nr:hypothetical protein FMEAI12_2340008 [Parafrankia sp. Ea1.12]